MRQRQTDRDRQRQRQAETDREREIERERERDTLEETIKPQRHLEVSDRLVRLSRVIHDEQ